jgi:hypothetical protein
VTLWLDISEDEEREGTVPSSSPVPTPYETDDYRVFVAEGLKQLKVYQLWNTRFDVMEYEDHVLARIVDVMLEFQEALNQVDKKFESPFSHFVEENDEGETGLH